MSYSILKIYGAEFVYLSEAQAAVTEERERCAKIVESRNVRYNDLNKWETSWSTAARLIREGHVVHNGTSEPQVQNEK